MCIEGEVKVIYKIDLRFYYFYYTMIFVTIFNFNKDIIPGFQREKTKSGYLVLAFLYF